MVRNRFPQIIYVRVEEDIGSACRFHIGMKTAYRRGNHFIWVMDDDVEVIGKDGLKTLLKIYYTKSEGFLLGA